MHFSFFVVVFETFCCVGVCALFVLQTRFWVYLFLWRALLFFAVIPGRAVSRVASRVDSTTISNLPYGIDHDKVWKI